ncbi:MAG: HisA/HisF-related TIM barrel protein, partial [Gammaproteobacteria bacterium]
MVIVDIDASRSGVLNPQIMERLAKECMMPLTVGGGVLTSAHADTLFRVGADKVVVNTGFFENRDLVEKISRKYGGQAVVVSLDYR